MSPEELSALVREAVREALAQERAQPAWMTRAQASRYLGVSVSMLERWSLDGGGPPFAHFGRAVRYSREALNAWAKAREQTRISVDEAEP